MTNRIARLGRKGIPMPELRPAVAEAGPCRWRNIGSRNAVPPALIGRHGFTVIELLVVTAIIAMIASVAFVQMAGYRARARDAEREREIGELQKALALYATDHRVFPVGSGVITGGDDLSAALLDASAIPAMPEDPLRTGDYVYAYDSPDGRGYTLTYTLETDSILGKAKGLQTATP